MIMTSKMKLILKIKKTNEKYYLRNYDNLKNKDNPKSQQNLKDENNLKREKDLQNQRHPQK